MILYSYSPIKTMRIKNFRNLGDVEISFEDSPIVTLIGENESGKTSVVKAFGVCAAHQSPRYQKYYIRNGTNGFGVAIELEDGTVVSRMKTETANVYRVYKGNEIVWEANKLESIVPKAVSDVMGLIEERETKELLQIRTYEDQLLFVITPASTNYRVMYDALKIKNISQAVKVGSAEANELKSKIATAEHSCETLQASLMNIHLFDIGPLLNIRDRLSIDMDVLDRLDKAAQLCDSIASQKQQLGVLNKLVESGIKEIDETLVYTLNNVGGIVEQASELSKIARVYREAENLADVDTSVIRMLDEATNRLTGLKMLHRESSVYADVVNALDIDTRELDKLEAVGAIKDELDKQYRMLKALDTSEASDVNEAELAQITKIDSVINSYKQIVEAKAYEASLVDYIEKVIAWMKSIGVATTDCPNCGESVIIDLDLINKP